MDGRRAALWGGRRGSSRSQCGHPVLSGSRDSLFQSRCCFGERSSTSSTAFIPPLKAPGVPQSWRWEPDPIAQSRRKTSASKAAFCAQEISYGWKPEDGRCSPGDAAGGTADRWQGWMAAHRGSRHCPVPAVGRAPEGFPESLQTGHFAPQQEQGSLAAVAILASSTKISHCSFCDWGTGGFKVTSSRFSICRLSLLRKGFFNNWTHNASRKDKDGLGTGIVFSSEKQQVWVSPSFLWRMNMREVAQILNICILKTTSAFWKSRARTHGWFLLWRMKIPRGLSLPGALCQGWPFPPPWENPSPQTRSGWKFLFCALALLRGCRRRGRPRAFAEKSRRQLEMWLSSIPGEDQEGERGQAQDCAQLRVDFNVFRPHCGVSGASGDQDVSRGRQAASVFRQIRAFAVTRQCCFPRWSEAASRWSLWWWLAKALIAAMPSRSRPWFGTSPCWH